MYGRHQYRHCMRRKLGAMGEMGKGFKDGQYKWNRRYFCPLMDCDIDLGGIMSKRYSRCRSAKLGALCPPMPVFKYAMLTPGIPRRPPGTDNWGACAKFESMDRADVGIPRWRLLWGCGACNKAT